MIVVEKAENSPQAPCCGGYMHTHQSPTPVKSRTPSTLNNPRHRTSIIQITPSEPTKEYLLSIGRIFHKIVLNESVITVTRFRPRHPYPPINVDYRYRFQAPQHNTYEVSGVNFTTEKLENFNWNYMDQYICTRGDTDYPLQEVILHPIIIAINRIFECQSFLFCTESEILEISHVLAATRTSCDQKNPG